MSAEAERLPLFMCTKKPEGEKNMPIRTQQRKTKTAKTGAKPGLFEMMHRQTLGVMPLLTEGVAAYRKHQAHQSAVIGKKPRKKTGSKGVGTVRLPVKGHPLHRVSPAARPPAEPKMPAKKRK